MVLFCCVVNCGSRGQRDDVRFFRIPAELNYKHRTDLNELSRVRRLKWFSAIKREDLGDKQAKYAVVCSKHFITGKPSDLSDSLHPDWIPTLNLGYQQGITTSSATKLQRYKQKRIKIEVVSEVSTAASTSQLSPTHATESDSAHICEQAIQNNKLMQTELASMDISKLNLELSAAISLQKQLQKRVINCENLKNDDQKTKYYTGLSTYTHFQVVAKLSELYMKIMPQTSLPANEQILFTLMKLRLNLDFKDLGFRFGISPSTASTYFKNTIHVMHLRLKNVVFWPTRDILKKNLPQCFIEAFHDKTTVIVDCFEIRAQTPSDLVTAAQSWSNYKHSKTIKYLIGITPQGSICFISEGWGGRVSDKCLTENSTFLNNLLPGDVVMADRGFLTKEFVELFRATVQIPAFTRGKSQLHPIELEKSRAISHCRIHVERVIGMLRQKFTILNDVVPIFLLSTGGDEPIFDKIVFVCCALINLINHQLYQLNQKQ